MHGQKNIKPSTEVKEREELYIYLPPSGPSWPFWEELYFTFTYYPTIYRCVV